MARYVTVAAAQSGPIPRSQSREEVLERRIGQLREAHALGCDLVVFTECALTPFFPHWWIEDDDEIDSYFEREMPGPSTARLFDEARRLSVGFYLGFAELAQEGGTVHRYNSSVLVGKDGSVIGLYRKVHLPGHSDHRPDTVFQNLERRYFEVGNLGFPTWRAFGGVVGMCICNDRRWPESFRLLGLGGAEMVLVGYNTPAHIPEHPELDRLANFQNLLSMQAGAYHNGSWVVGVAKAGVEEGVPQIGQSAIIAPSGEVVAMSSTLGDEVIAHRCDLDMTRAYKEFLLDFDGARRIEHYGPIANQTGAVAPDDDVDR